MRSESEAPQHIGADHILSLLHRLRLDWLLQHFPPRLVRSAYVFVNGFITIGLLALLALLSPNPFVFPSLGPTAYLLFFSPLNKASSPRSTILGHAIAIVCGYGAFAVAGAGAQPFAAHLGIFWPRILAAALSLSTTAALMVLLGINHPPGGATTLIISLGIISKPRELVIIEVAVFLLVAQALVINRLAGLPYLFGPAQHPNLEPVDSRLVGGPPGVAAKLGLRRPTLSSLGWRNSAYQAHAGRHLRAAISDLPVASKSVPE